MERPNLLPPQNVTAEWRAGQYYPELNGFVGKYQVNKSEKYLGDRSY